MMEIRKPLTNPRVQFVGISLNTSRMSTDERTRALADLERQFYLPCFDSMQGGLDQTVLRVMDLMKT